MKFVALAVPEIIGVLKNWGQSLDTPSLPFLPNFINELLFEWTLSVPAKFEVRIAIVLYTRS